MQLVNTPPLQSTAPGLHPVSIHQTSPPVRGSKRPITAYYSIYRPRKDERLSRPGWLVTYRNKVPPPGVEPGHVTHPSTNRARRRVTSLIRPTPLPLRHAATTSSTAEGGQEDTSRTFAAAPVYSVSQLHPPYHHHHHHHHRCRRHLRCCCPTCVQHLRNQVPEM